MKVIGAGLPRTGTLSQKVALEMLGFGPCYHMVNVLADLSLLEQWSNAMDGEADWTRSSASTSRPLTGPVPSSTASSQPPTPRRRWC